MIPLRLQLKNFISYGPTLQTIDFGPYPLICLAGKNGHGKSALLDAITWAVWGQARKVATAVKADNNLLHLGQTHMMVLFDFEFNNQRYRIKREYAQTYGKPYAQLEFGIINPETESFQPLTDKTIRATQERIQEHLGLDFNAFTNSAFLRQGSANEFSKKSPKERKEIIASILSLQQYENLRKSALEKIKSLNSELTITQQLQERLRQEILKKNDISLALQNVTTALQKIVEEEKQLESDKVAVQEKKKKSATAQDQFKLLDFQLKQLSSKKETQQKKLIALHSQWQKNQQQQRTIDSKEKLNSDKQTIEQKIGIMNAQFQEQLVLKEKILELKTSKHQFLTNIHDQNQQAQTAKQIELQQLDAELKSTNQILHERTQQITQIKEEAKKITEEIKKLEEEKKNLAISPSAIQKIEQQFEKRKQHYHKWIAQANSCKVELSALEQKQQFTHETDNPSCPLCEQNLSASRKRFLHQKFEDQQLWLTHRYKRYSTLITTLKKLLIDQHEDLETQKKKRNQEQQLTNQIELLRKNLVTIHASIEHQIKLEQTVASTLKEISQKRTTLENELHVLQNEQKKSLENSQEYKNLTTALTKTEKALTENVYNPKQLQEYKEQLQLIEKQLALCANHDELTITGHQLKQTILALLMELRTYKKELLSLEREHKSFSYLPILENEIRENEERIDTITANLNKQKEENLQEKGRLENQSSKITSIQKELEEHEQQCKKLQETIHDFQIVATSMGKDGIQALLIENAIPEIEQEANALLAQLTDNQAHIFIESLRDLKKGGTKETLDIVISDSAGIRPYELFSGGEAFRIDFALRIAISKLLARRAGTSLQTLIIDEGFGSQDEEGLSRIMDALYKIQDNFKKIIVVSHLGWMKDQFPVQFAVHKGPNGSVVNMIEQG